MKYKIGQKVKVISSTYMPNKISLEMIGNIYEINGIDCSQGIFIVGTSDKIDSWVFFESDLEAVQEEKTWDTLQVDDVLIDDNGKERVVLGVCGKIVFYSVDYDKDEVSSYATEKKLIKSFGWKIKQNTPTEEVVKDEKAIIEDIKKGLQELLKKLEQYN